MPSSPGAALRIPVHQPQSQRALEELIRRIGALDALVRERAFALFAARRGPGPADHETQDWLNAEAELLAAVETAVEEGVGGLRIDVSLAGRDVNSLRVTLIPGLLLVEASAEAGLKPVLEQFDTPRGLGPVPEASFSEGVLSITLSRGALVKEDELLMVAVG